MIDADKPEFLKVLNGMAVIKRIELPKESIAMWWECMRGDWDLEEFKIAAAHVMKTSKWMPQPSDFHEIKKTGRDTAGEAWSKALKHASSSAYRNGNLGEEMIDRCARMIGGYQTIAMCDNEKLGFLERRFCEHYETLEDRIEVRSALPSLAYSNPIDGNLKVIAGSFKKLGK